MLILTRVVGEWTVVGGELPALICVTKPADERVTLGICAHEDIPIYRMELLRDIIARNLHAAGISPDERNTLEQMEMLLLDPAANDKAIVRLLAEQVMVDLLCGDHRDN
ncbi:MAG: carbon storage regulator [Candidatus Peribacteraceae bacterium]|nr:carbon storage regulator [Candidatus Peribacteraceae bacterium]